MRKFIVLSVLITLLTSCFHVYSNGDLDGYWKLVQVDSLASGVKVDKSDDVKFWGIRAKLLCFYDHGNQKIICRFNHKGDSLIVTEPCWYGWKGTPGTYSLEEPVINVKDVKPYGMNDLEGRYKMEQLNDDEMILRDNTVRLYFTRF